jgi:hypothetical protein
MYENMRGGFEKIREAIPNLRPFKRAAIMGVVLPTGESLDTFLPSYLYIAVVSLLDDALKEFIAVNYPTGKPDGLKNRICFLNAKRRKRLNNPAKLKDICEARNAYAHEPGTYASWADVEVLLSTVQEELQHLGVL